ncbi:5'-3' exonuclease [Blastococcus brunescens]|uniref:5'-3' exonuclease n=1 Tax=Blastococcus brunescens TaxID=1564165 RepID=A0ABZ1B841_9ACTN|nr:5'-3' exonuclease [Blastococcus sp. BMG 8361]WRL66988.1 5'-3' exonuclease [Blastococcus sp. BMG 8361]
MLLDAASLYFRAFYGVPTSVTTPDGRPINAVRGFLDMTARLIAAHGPDRLVACWDDDWRPAFRVAALPSYKAHRVAVEGGEEVPDELSPQVPVLVEVLAAAGVDRVGAPGFEADDVIGTLATRARGPVDVVTGDRDLFQLVDDAREVRILYTARGISDIEFVDEAAVAAKYGIPGRAYADFAVLRGDPSDGLPGVAGVGAKTAAALINEFGDLAGIRAAVARTVVPKPPLTAAVLKKMLAAADYLDAAPVVVAVAKAIDLPPVEEASPVPRRPGGAGRARGTARHRELGQAAGRGSRLAGGRAGLRVRARSTCRPRWPRR